MPRAQAVWRTIKSSSKIFNCPDVVAYGSLCVIKTLEFFQHHFAKSGHRDLLMTRQLISTNKQPLLRSSHAKRPPQSGFVQVSKSSMFVLEPKLPRMPLAPGAWCASECMVASIMPMRTFPKSLATLRKIVNERGELLRKLSQEELTKLASEPPQELEIDSRPATIGIIGQPRPGGSLRVVVQGT